jgi:hypothetical protein
MKEVHIRLKRKRKQWLEDGEVMMMEMVWECCDPLSFPPPFALSDAD